ncbi:MAG: hypothetical protein U0990_08400 [Candidatus Nanopelagicales bacterium]|nr:hypothetical protein [Candidatus Nanopelagicales bacterium]MDZ4250096.1 hypothetical protein [Candidatus Nanopelagicales bacterium]
MAAKPNIPAQLATPPSIHGAPHVLPLKSAYAAIHQTSPKLLPDEAVAIAHRAANFAALRPQPRAHLDAAKTQWRADVREAVENGSTELPSLADLAQGIAEEAAATQINDLLSREWIAVIVPMGAVLAEHGDAITEGMRPAHDAAWEAFQLHVERLTDYKNEGAVLRAGTEAAAAFGDAGAASAALSATRHARLKLNELKGYRARARDELLVFRTAPRTKPTGTRLPGDSLQRWRAIIADWGKAGPYLATRSEAEAAHIAASGTQRGAA